jgi:opine dehydrogenase
MSHPPVAIIGAGNVGCALAADLAIRGNEVRLFNRSEERLAPIREAGGITASGQVEGIGHPDLITRVLADALRGAGVVAVTVPTPALPNYAPLLADALSDDQVVWLNPGHSGGALYLAAEIERLTGRRGLKLCQLSTASHGSRMTGPASVGVFNLSRAGLAAVPAGNLDQCFAAIDGLLPGQFTRLRSVLEADLLNINAILHPPGMVCNAGWIEATQGGFRFYSEGNGPGVCRVMEAIDRERLTLAERLEVPTVPFVEMFYRAGFTTAEAAQTGSAHAALRASDAIREIKSPPSLDHRYLHEDVGWGLVQWEQLAGACGVQTPAISAVTRLAGAINGVDYTREGLTLERMGLEGMSAPEIRAAAG